MLKQVKNNLCIDLPIELPIVLPIELLIVLPIVLPIALPIPLPIAYWLVLAYWLSRKHNPQTYRKHKPGQKSGCVVVLPRKSAGCASEKVCGLCFRECQ